MSDHPFRPDPPAPVICEQCRRTIPRWWERYTAQWVFCWLGIAGFVCVLNMAKLPECPPVHGVFQTAVIWLAAACACIGAAVIASTIVAAAARLRR